MNDPHPEQTFKKNQINGKNTNNNSDSQLEFPMAEPSEKTHEFDLRNEMAANDDPKISPLKYHSGTTTSTTHLAFQQTMEQRRMDFKESTEKIIDKLIDCLLVSGQKHSESQGIILIITSPKIDLVMKLLECLIWAGALTKRGIFKTFRGLSALFLKVLSCKPLNKTDL